MADAFQYDVFLSHSAKDKAVVRPLAERLRKDGLKVWFDEWVLKPGDSIPAKIEEGLEHSRVLVLCMSAHAFGSDWAQLEAGTFRFRDPLNKERRFIPLRLDDAPIKGSLAQFLYINWRPEDREHDYSKLVEACRRRLGSDSEEVQNADDYLAENVIQLECNEVINTFAFKQDGRSVATGGWSNSVRLWELESGQCFRVLNGHHGSVFALAWDTDRRRILSGANDNTLRLWDTETARCARVFEGHKSAVYTVAWSNDEHRVLSGSDDGTVRLWEVETGRCIRVFEIYEPIYCVEWSRDQRFFITGGKEMTLKVWDVATGLCLRTSERHSMVIFAVGTADYNRALFGVADKTMRLHNLELGQTLRIFEGHTDAVKAIAWSPDNRLALSGSWDRTVRLWNISTGNCLRVLSGHKAKVVGVGWSADQRKALSGDDCGGIQFGIYRYWPKLMIAL